MSVSVKFRNFCDNVRISETKIETIAYRYKRITKQLNKSYWDTESETAHSLYVGSFGRDTEIHTSDIDMLFQLPFSVYKRINGYMGNGQSALLAEVRDHVMDTYRTTHIRGDGQVVVVNFDDGISFEIVPSFLNTDGTYTYPDSNSGGKWRTTDPKSEITEIRTINDECNGNLKRLCRMARVWKDEWNVPMSGILLDTLAYQFMKQWTYRNESYLYYDLMIRDFFDYLKNQASDKLFWHAPGSSRYVYKIGDFQYKALRSYNIATQAVIHEANNESYSANYLWRQIFGSKI